MPQSLASRPRRASAKCVRAIFAAALFRRNEAVLLICLLC